MNKITILFFALFAISCHKDSILGPLKSVAKARYNGLYEVQFDNVYSSGPIERWEWSIDNSSSTSDSLFTPVSGNQLFPFVRKVHKPGQYTFALRVFDKDGNESFSSVTVNITGSLWP